MSKQVSLRCRCGRVRGVVSEVSPELGNRLICHCDDCQAFARFLERDDVLDGWGGTDVFQVAPSRVSITEGLTDLRCVRLTEKGLFRWYTDCCRTPVGNVLSPRVAFVGVIHPFMDLEDRDAVLGKPVGYIHGRFAVGNPPPHVHRTASLGVVARSARLILGWSVTGKGKPSPFFDSAGGPTAVPQVLRPEEREALRTRPRGRPASA
jgi:hypothetical protein